MKYEYKKIDECVLDYFMRQNNLIVKPPEMPEESESEPELEEEQEINVNGRLIKISLFTCALLLFVL